MLLFLLPIAALVLWLLYHFVTSGEVPWVLLIIWGAATLFIGLSNPTDPEVWAWGFVGGWFLTELLGTPVAWASRGKIRLHDDPKEGLSARGTTVGWATATAVAVTAATMTAFDLGLVDGTGAQGPVFFASIVLGWVAGAVHDFLKRPAQKADG